MATCPTRSPSRLVAVLPSAPPAASTTSDAAGRTQRARGQGRITRIEGLEEWLAMCGDAVVEEKLLRPGTPRRNWKHTLLCDGHVLVRHRDWNEAYRMSFAAATGITMYAE